MENAIFSEIKKMIGFEDDYEAFDTDLLIHINSAISVLTQLGVGPKEGFIATQDSTWIDFLGISEKIEHYSMAKEFIYLKVKTVFDPPASSSVHQSYERVIKELEWRINVSVDPIKVV